MADDDRNLQPRANPPVGWIVDGNGSFVRSTRPDRNYDTAGRCTGSLRDPYAGSVSADAILTDNERVAPWLLQERAGSP
jgi:hypothetical protein